MVCGRSKNVGLPIALLLQADSKKTKWGLDATVSICNRNTSRSQLSDLCRFADIIVSATGVPNLITADIVKPGACVIDVGITRIQNENGTFKLVGDVDFEGNRRILVFLIFLKLFLFRIFRGFESGRPYYTSSWGCWTHDCGYVDAKCT